MLRMLTYLLKEGVATTPRLPLTLPAETRSLPKLTENPCTTGCDICEKICPTDAIVLEGTDLGTALKIDLGACINCSLCITNCPSGTIASDNSVATARLNRSDLILSKPNESQPKQSHEGSTEKTSNKVSTGNSIFRRSIACRVISTGCAACDLELAACSNPIFDMERFGISIVASPRFADVLLITGAVPKSMHQALKSCYMAMSEPRKVIAVGTCACSGGLHKGGYAEANGVSDLLPVDIFVPGCPPHPWSIVEALLRLMNN